MRELLEEVLDDSLVVVAPTEYVVERGKTMSLASFFLMVQLFGVESVIANHSPVIARRVHRETGS